MDPARPWAQAVAWRDGIVIAVGDDDAVREVCDARTEVVDGSGGGVTPGLVDGHQHLFRGAVLAHGVDLAGAADLDEVRHRLWRGRGRLRDGEWLIARGLEYATLGDRAYHHQLLGDLDEAVPMLIWSFDLHTAYVNAAALRAAAVTGERDLGDRSRIVCTDAGDPTGELREWAAVDVVRDVAPDPAPDRLREWYREAIQAQNAVGLTGIHQMDGDGATVELLRELDDSGDLRLRVWLYQFVYASTPDATVEAMVRGGRPAGRRWRADGIKIMLDGVIDTGTAWLERPDACGQCRDAIWPDIDRFASRVRQFHAAGLRVATHAIGDRAVRATLDAYAQCPGGSAGRHRIEHLETVPDGTAERFARDEVTASMQPIAMGWVAPDQSDPWSQRLDARRRAHGWRTGDLVDAGAVVVLGSDWPVGTFDPRHGLFAARERRAPGAADPRPVGDTRGLTGLEALGGYTTGPARAVGAQGWSGRLAPGFAADLVLWAEDPADCPVTDVAELPVRLTVLAGDIVHSPV